MPDLKIKIGTEADTSGLKHFSSAGVEAGRVINELEVASQGGVRGFIALGSAAKNAFKILGSAIAASPMLAFAAAVTAVVAGFVAWAQKVNAATNASIKLSNAQDTLKDHTSSMVSAGVSRLDLLEAKLKDIKALYDSISGDISQGQAHSAEVTNAQKQLELAKLAPGDEAGRAAVEKKYVGISASNRIGAAQVTAGLAEARNSEVQGKFRTATTDIEGVRSRLASVQGDILRTKKGEIIQSPENIDRVRAASVLQAQLTAMEPGYRQISDEANASQSALGRANQGVKNAQELGAIEVKTAALQFAQPKTSKVFDSASYSSAQAADAAAQSALTSASGLSSDPVNQKLAAAAAATKANLNDIARYYIETTDDIAKTKRQMKNGRDN